MENQRHFKQHRNAVGSCGDIHDGLQRVDSVWLLFRRKPDASSDFDKCFLYGQNRSDSGAVAGKDGEQSELVLWILRQPLASCRTSLLEHDRIRIYFFYVSHRFALANGSRMGICISRGNVYGVSQLCVVSNRRAAKWFQRRHTSWQHCVVQQ